MEYKDYYKIMDVPRTASQEEIKRSYRKLARKYHPDVSKQADAETKFKELGEAYEVLRDPEKRAKYDQFGENWKNPPQENYQHAYQSGEQAVDFEDFLASMFGGQRRRYQHTASSFDEGSDIHAKLSIDLIDSYLGSEKSLQLQTSTQTRTIKVKIPKGIEDSKQIRLKGQGEKGQGTRAGDLYIEIHINPHPWFKHHKKDILLDLPISPWEATLGASLSVPTLGGIVKLKIPKLSQTGKQLRLKGRGLPGAVAGDQIVTLKIVIPETDNEKVSALYKEIADLSKFNPRATLGVPND